MVFRGTCHTAGGIKVKSKKEIGGRGQNHGGGASARRGWTPTTRDVEPSCLSVVAVVVCLELVVGFQGIFVSIFMG